MTTTLTKILTYTLRPLRKTEHDTRKSSLQDCLDTGTRRRSRWNHWVLLFGLLSATIYLYHHRTHYLPAMNNEIHNDHTSLDTIESTDHHVTLKMIGLPRPIARPNTANTVQNTASNTKKPSGDFYKSDILSKGSGLRPRKQLALKMPVCYRKKPYAKFDIKMKSVGLRDENIYPMVRKGGSYQPPDCTARFKVGIVVPYRNRERNLGIFLYNIHPFLMRQKLDYQIFVIEQHDDGELFNKGRLLNAGFNEMLKFNTFHCVVFHDLDLLPVHENIAYSCPTLPRHMCARVNDTEMKRFYPSYTFENLFGGVVSITRDQFESANGYSNLYWGWGAEDNDMFWRLRASGYPIVRYNSSIGVYLMQPHTREQENPFRHHLLSSAVERYKIDGLSNVEYYVISTKFLPLCTHIVVDINPRADNITKLNQKWSKTKYY